MASAVTDKSYDDHEVESSQAARGISDSNNHNNNNNNNDDDDSCPQLAVVPLHPACKNQKLEAKQLPIVLGRTNLASWWWKSCPCQHYCRLHCRPVAQNIRSLSKVMIQIDTAGRIHMCGKNPHLVTIIPERNDRYLQVNDIISIGRRDREPWMRLQVVEKPNGNQLPPRKLVTDTPECMTTQNDLHLHDHRKSNPSSNNNSNNNNNNNAVAALNAATSYNNHSRHHSSNNNSKNNNNNNNQSSSAVGNNPPEWITTRKRKSSRRAFNASKPPPNNTNTNTNTNTNGDSDSPPRKRSRRSDKRQRRNKTEDSDKNGAPLVEKDHPPQVHLVFQDYETSANLLKGLQRTKKRSRNTTTSTINPPPSVETSSMSSSNVVPQHHHHHHHHHNVPSTHQTSIKRNFLSDNSQLRLLSKSFADALRGEVPPPTADAQPSEPDAKPAAAAVAVVGGAGWGGDKCDGESGGPEKIRAQEELPETQPARKVEDEEDADHDNNNNINNINNNKSDEKSSPVLEDPDPAAATAAGRSGENQHGVSLLSLPQCASSGGSDDTSPRADEEETNGDIMIANHSSTIIPVPEERAARNPQQPDDADNASSEGDDGTPGINIIRDPTSMELERWREVIKNEEGKRNEASFRHALASLVVAKNEKSGKETGAPIWLPSMLENSGGDHHPHHHGNSPGSGKEES
jgi:hypothetical protein